MKKKIVMALLACMISSSLILTSCGQNAKSVTTSDKSTEKKNSFSEDDIKDVITGLEDHYILQDAADIDYLYGVTYDTDIVKKVKADSGEVKLNKTGTYTVTYTVTVDRDALEDYLDEKESADKKSEEKNAEDKKNAETDVKDTTDSKEDSKKEDLSKEEQTTDSKENPKEDVTTEVDDSKKDSGNEEESEKSEDKTEEKSEEKEDSESDSKKDDKKEESKDSEKSDSDSKKEEESKKDDTVDVKVDKDMTVVDKDQAKDLADKDEVVWGDKNTPVEKSDGSEVKEEEKVPESIKSDSTSDTKTDSKKEESKKNETGSASTSTGNTGSGSSTAGSGNSGSSSGGQAQQPVKPPHTHKFVPHYTTTTKQTGQEWVPNWVQVGSKTVCNGCGADITGHIEHSFECGNGGYHSEPIYEDQGWYEPVYSEVQVIDYYYCSFCGQRQ